MQKDRSRKRHTKKHAEMRLIQVKRVLKQMENSLGAHRKPMYENLDKAGRLGEKLKRLWLQPVFFDELMKHIHRHNDALEDVAD